MAGTPPRPHLSSPLGVFPLGVTLHQPWGQLQEKLSWMTTHRACYRLKTSSVGGAREGSKTGIPFTCGGMRLTQKTGKETCKTN